MTHHSFQLLKIRIIQHHSLAIILIKLVISPKHGKCLLTQIPQNKHRKWFFFQGNLQKRIILPYISVIYQSPRLPFKTYWAVPWCKTQLRKLSNKLPRQGLITIYKPFLRPHLDYSDIVYDEPNNETFINEIEKGQHDAALTITGAIRGTSLEKLYAELGLESLTFRRWFEKLACFYKIQSTGLPKYLLQLIPLIIIPTFWGSVLISHIITAELIHPRIHFFQMP